MQEQPSTKPTIAIENTPHNGGVIVAWKDGLVSSAIGNKKKSFEEKARERSISVGMDHGMALLGKLHENESNSRSCVLERTSELPSPSEILPPTMMEGRPPLDPQPRAWSRSISTTSDHIGRHHDKRTFVASLGEASIGTLGAVSATHVLMRSALARHQTTHQEAVMTTHPSRTARLNASKRQPTTIPRSGLRK